MRPISQTLNGPAAALQIPLDIYEDPFSVAIDCVVTGTVTYEVQASNDEPFSGTAPTDFITATPIASGSVSAQATVSVPVRQLYASVTAGTGSVTIRVIQAGNRG